MYFDFYFTLDCLGQWLERFPGSLNPHTHSAFPFKCTLYVLLCIVILFCKSINHNEIIKLEIRPAAHSLLSLPSSGSSMGSQQQLLRGFSATPRELIHLGIQWDFQTGWKGSWLSWYCIFLEAGCGGQKACSLWVYIWCWVARARVTPQRPRQL